MLPSLYPFFAIANLPWARLAKDGIEGGKVKPALERGVRGRTIILSKKKDFNMGHQPPHISSPLYTVYYLLFLTLFAFASLTTCALITRPSHAQWAAAYEEGSYGMVFAPIPCGIAGNAKEPGCVIPPPENRAIITAKFLELDKTEPLRVVVTAKVLHSEDVKGYPNFTEVGQEINVLFAFYPRREIKELDTDNPVNKERLGVLGFKKGEIFGVEVSLSNPSMWFGHRAWKEPSGDRK